MRKRKEWKSGAWRSWRGCKNAPAHSQRAAEQERAIDCRLCTCRTRRKGSSQNQMSSFGKKLAGFLTHLAQGPLWLSSTILPMYINIPLRSSQSLSSAANTCKGTGRGWECTHINHSCAWKRVGLPRNRLKEILKLIQLIWSVHTYGNGMDFMWVWCLLTDVLRTFSSSTNRDSTFMSCRKDLVLLPLPFCDVSGNFFLQYPSLVTFRLKRSHSKRRHCSFLCCMLQKIKNKIKKKLPVFCVMQYLHAIQSH